MFASLRRSNSVQKADAAAGSSGAESYRGKTGAPSKNRTYIHGRPDGREASGENRKRSVR